MPKPQVIAGNALATGFILIVDYGPGGQEVLAVKPGGYTIRPRPLPPPHLRPLGSLGRLLALLPAPLALTLYALLLGFLYGGLSVHAPEVSLTMLLSFLGFACFVQLTGIARWHALEHKAAHVLQEVWERGLSPDRYSLLSALKRASPFHPQCGTLLFARFILLATPLLFFLNFTPAMILSYALAGLMHHKQFLAVPLLGLERLLLAAPREAEEIQTAVALEAYLKARALA